MQKETLENNKATISGEIVSDFAFSHEVFGEGFYTTHLSAKRISGVVDVIPIMVSERLVDVKADWKGRQVEIEGPFRSYNKHDDGGNHLILSVFARKFDEFSQGVADMSDDVNEIFFDGYICKEPKYRETPFGREITDILVAVNRPYKKSDYIPCIVWGRNARFAGHFEVGTRVAIEGRIQSRKYLKKISDTEAEKRVAYEVSVGKIEILKEARW